MAYLDDILGGEERKTKHLKLFSGLIISGIGALALGKIFNMLPFTLNVSDSDLLLVASVGSLIGGLYLVFTSFER